VTNTDTILAQIRATPGLTDAELVERTGVRPHQQVNAICNRLQARRLIRRPVGPSGSIVNMPIGATPGVSRPSSPVRPARQPAVASSSSALSDIARLDPARTLLVLPCSGSKTRGGGIGDAPGLCDVVPPPQARALSAARERVKARAGVDERQRMPARQRYTGSFYETAARDLSRALAVGAHAIILSGGYGALLPDEPIGYYDAAFRISWWPEAVVARSVAAYAKEKQLTSVLAFLAKSTDYARALRGFNWSAQSIATYLVSPEMDGAGGAQRAVPVALGETFAAFVRHELDAAWRSKSGLTLSVERLP
jgi:hypothetical protein